MRPDDLIRLRHILDAGREAMGFVRDRTRDDLDRDHMLVLALIKEIEIIGEAAYQLRDETKAKVTGVPWDEIVAMRHRLVHAYFDIDLDILWKAVKEELPPLVAEVEKHVPEEQ